MWLKGGQKRRVTCTGQVREDFLEEWAFSLAPYVGRNGPGAYSWLHFRIIWGKSRFLGPTYKDSGFIVLSWGKDISIF